MPRPDAFETRTLCNEDYTMRNIIFLASAAAFFAIPHVASAQEGTAAGAATGAVTGAIIGGPVGAVIGAGVGGIAGGIAEQNSRTQPPAGTVVVPSDAITTGSIRQRTCIEDAYGNLSCRNVIR
jgi:hypothetical protein